MGNVVALVRPADDPESRSICTTSTWTTFYAFAYHDTTYMGINRAKMDKAMFDVLKPGGFLIIADHSARPEERCDGWQDLSPDRRTDIARRGSRRPVSKFVADAGFASPPRGHSHRHCLPQSHTGGRVRAEVQKAQPELPERQTSGLRMNRVEPGMIDAAECVVIGSGAPGIQRGEASHLAKVRQAVVAAAGQACARLADLSAAGGRAYVAGARHRSDDEAGQYARCARSRPSRRKPAKRSRTAQPRRAEDRPAARSIWRSSRGEVERGRRMGTGIER